MSLIGFNALPIIQKTNKFTKTKKNNPRIANSLRSSQASKIAREGFGMTSTVNACAGIINGSTYGETRFENHLGAFLPALYLLGGES